mgnify:CR=1 FL=1
MERIITYQIGVDVLGFPIYVQHEIHEGETNQNKFWPKPKKRWLKVIESIIKQR